MTAAMVNYNSEKIKLWSNKVYSLDNLILTYFLFELPCQQMHEVIYVYQPCNLFLVLNLKRVIICFQYK